MSARSNFEVGCPLPVLLLLQLLWFPLIETACHLHTIKSDISCCRLPNLQKELFICFAGEMESMYLHRLLSTIAGELNVCWPVGAKRPISKLLLSSNGSQNGHLCKTKIVQNMFPFLKIVDFRPNQNFLNQYHDSSHHTYYRTCSR